MCSDGRLLASGRGSRIPASGEVAFSSSRPVVFSNTKSIEYMAKKDVGGRIARNFRPGHIAESLATDLCRPFLAIAKVEQEEDFGVDFVGTLLRRSARVMIAEQSCMIQVKISSSARFEFRGDGIHWLRQLVLPYFPLVVDRATSSASLFTLNDWHRVIFPTLVDEYVFVLPDDMQNDPGDSFFSLGDPLMTWDPQESADPEFARWAYSVMHPAIQIETLNQRYGAAGRFAKMVGRSYRFRDRGSDGLAQNPPSVGETVYHRPGDYEVIIEDLESILTPFANLVANTNYPSDRSNDLAELKRVLERLGVQPDPDGSWDALIVEMAEHATDTENDNGLLHPNDG